MLVSAVQSHNRVAFHGSGLLDMMLSGAASLRPTTQHVKQPLCTHVFESSQRICCLVIVSTPADTPFYRDARFCW